MSEASLRFLFGKNSLQRDGTCFAQIFDHEYFEQVQINLTATGLSQIAHVCEEYLLIKLLNLVENSAKYKFSHTFFSK